MTALYQAIVFVHVVAGGIGLLSLAIPLIARKGGPLHRRAGWLFAIAIGVATLSSLIIAASWICIPAVVKPKAVGQVAALRTFGAFFGLLGLAGANALISGIAAIGRRRASITWLRPLATRTTWALAIASPAVVWLGFASGSILLIAFGALFTVGAIADLRRPALSGHRTVLVAHVEAMLGAGTVATTAFTVQFASRLGAASQFALVSWMAPVALGMLATVVWRRRVAAGRYTRAV